MLNLLTELTKNNDLIQLKNKVEKSKNILDYLKFVQHVNKNILPILKDTDIRSLFFYNDEGNIIYEVIIENSNERYHQLTNQFQMFLWGRKHDLDILNLHVKSVLTRKEPGINNIISINNLFFNVVYTPSAIGYSSQPTYLLVKAVKSSSTNKLTYGSYTVNYTYTNGLYNINISELTQIVYTSSSYNQAYSYNSTSTSSLVTNLNQIKDVLMTVVCQAYSDTTNQGNFFATIFNSLYFG